MKKTWWKFLGIALLLYVFIVGLTTPLRPGPFAVYPSSSPTGSNLQFELHTYNTEYDATNLPEIWLSPDNTTRAFKANRVECLSRNKISFDIHVPDSIEQLLYHVLALDEKHGQLFLPEAISFNTRIAQHPNENHFQAVKKTETEQTGFTFPYRSMLYETVRNLFLHVPMWFTMMLLMGISCFYSIRYLSGFDHKYDILAHSAVKVGLLFAFLGLFTGSLWARFTWMTWWTSDSKLNGAAITTLIYLAYLVLRNSIKEEQSRARLSAIYNIFAFVLLLVFIMVIPRMLDTLHPGNGGNPAFSKYDLDSSLRRVFYPAVLGWMLLGVWIFQVKHRINRLIDRQHEV